MSNHILPRDLEACDVDVAGLRKFYRVDLNAPKILDIFASRPNDSHITTVSSLVARLKGAGFAITRPEIMRVFRALERFNCGKFIKEKSSCPVLTRRLGLSGELASSVSAGEQPIRKYDDF